MSEASDVRFQVAPVVETMSMCLRCGAMVGDEQAHRRFHAGPSALIEALQMVIMFGG